MKTEITIFQITPNTIIIDKDKVIDEDVLNELMHDKIIERGDVRKEDKRASRVVRENQYVVIHAHGSFAGTILEDWVAELLNSENDLRVLQIAPTPELKKAVKHLLPTYSIFGGSLTGGPVGIRDSDTIDEHVEKLCIAFNGVEGISTFASCDGHRGARSFYILFSSTTIPALETLVLNIMHVVNSYFEDLNINLDYVNTGIETHHMPDGSPRGVYFKFFINYPPQEADKIYEFADLAANHIMDTFGVPRNRRFINTERL